MKFDKSVFLQKDSYLFTYIKLGNVYIYIVNLFWFYRILLKC